MIGGVEIQLIDDLTKLELLWLWSAVFFVVGSIVYFWALRKY